MNTLQKCVEELKKEKPDIRYLLGMLETYMELSGGAKTPGLIGFPPTPRNIIHVPGVVDLSDENQLPPGYADGPIGKIT